MLTKKTKLLVRECLPPIILRLIRLSRSVFTREDHSGKCKERTSDFYDKTFLDGDHWRRHYTKSRYFPIWAIIADRIRRTQIKSVLDVGCGPGQVAALLRDIGIQKYLGIDFSAKRIKQARKVCPEFDFVLVNVFDTDILRNHDYDAVICFEFLEHVEGDLHVLQNLRPGTRFWASVPNFGGGAHIRYFHNGDEVTQRYGDYFDDFRVDEHIADDKEKKYFLLEGVIK